MTDVYACRYDAALTVTHAVLSIKEQQLPHDALGALIHAVIPVASKTRVSGLCRTPSTGLRNPQVHRSETSVPNPNQSEVVRSPN